MARTLSYYETGAMATIPARIANCFAKLRFAYLHLGKVDVRRVVRELDRVTFNVPSPSNAAALLQVLVAAIGLFIAYLSLMPSEFKAVDWISASKAVAGTVAAVWLVEVISRATLKRYKVRRLIFSRDGWETDSGLKATWGEFGGYRLTKRGRADWLELLDECGNVAISIRMGDWMFGFSEYAELVQELDSRLGATSERSLWGLTRAQAWRQFGLGMLETMALVLLIAFGGFALTVQAPKDLQMSLLAATLTSVALLIWNTLRRAAWAREQLSTRPTIDGLRWTTHDVRPVSFRPASAIVLATCLVLGLIAFTIKVPTVAFLLAIAIWIFVSSVQEQMLGGRHVFITRDSLCLLRSGDFACVPLEHVDVDLIPERFFAGTSRVVIRCRGRRYIVKNDAFGEKETLYSLLSAAVQEARIDSPGRPGANLLPSSLRCLD